jgi:hypothetical protein
VHGGGHDLQPAVLHVENKLINVDVVKIYLGALIAAPHDHAKSRLAEALDPERLDPLVVDERVVVEEHAERHGLPPLYALDHGRAQKRPEHRVIVDGLDRRDVLDFHAVGRHAFVVFC